MEYKQQECSCNSQRQEFVRCLTIFPSVASTRFIRRLFFCTDGNHSESKSRSPPMYSRGAGGRGVAATVEGRKAQVWMGLVVINYETPLFIFAAPALCACMWLSYLPLTAKQNLSCKGVNKYDLLSVAVGALA